jgi:Tfp pilus assembly protein PilF
MPNQLTLQTHLVRVKRAPLACSTRDGCVPRGDDSERMTSIFLNHRALVFAAMLLVLCAVLTASSPAGAQEQRLARRAGHINDSAEVFDAATKERLEAVLEKVKDKTRLDFVVATIKTAGSEDLYDYSLALANDWKVGAPASADRSLLIVIATDNGRFFSQVSRGARIYLPEGLVGEMGQRIREKVSGGSYGPALMTGLRVFVDRLGEKNNFDFASLDPQRGENIAQVQRPRTVQSLITEPSENPQPTRTPAAEATTKATPESTPTPEPSATAAAALPTATASPAAQPTETPTPEASTPPAKTPTPVESPSQTPAETVTPQTGTTASPQASRQTPAVAANSPKALRTPAPDRKPAASPMSPEDELDQVELTQTLPAEKRIGVLKDWIATHPTSTALPRAKEILVVAHAQFAGQRMQAGELDKGLEQFRLALSDASADMPDRLFTEVLARIPLSLYSSGLRDPALEIARQLEPLAKSNGKRMVTLSEFYLTIENAGEANRVAESAVQTAPDLAAAHQALGAARHIDLRLDDAESEYAKALALDPKSNTARIALADLKRASGKNEEAVTLYREQLQADAKSNRARAGLILSLLELGKKEEGEAELNKALQDKDQSRNLPLLVGVAYWFMAHNNADRGYELAQRAVALEPRYSWGEITLARALIAKKQPLQAERGLRFAQGYSRFPTLDYELATALASTGLYDEAVAELARSFSLKDGELQTKLAGRIAAHAPSFTELLAPERRAVIFQAASADTEANARMMKALLALNSTLDQSSPNEDNLIALAQDFIKGDDAMRTYRQVYVAGKFLKKGVALSAVVQMMDQASTGVEVALGVPAATVAVQVEELADSRARALSQGGTIDVPDAPRSALSGLLRGRIEDLAGLALFNLDKPADAVVRLRRAVNTATEGTPLWRSSMWHLGAALEANGKNDQALLYYIKSYVNGPPDRARRSIIENVYKKVNGTLDGLEDKIGPGFAAASASPTPSP